MQRVAILLASWFIVSPLAGAEPEKIDLFEANTHDYAIYRIPGIVVTKANTILAYCEARKSASDWGTIDLLMRRSTDGGKTWSQPTKIAEAPGPIQRNPVAVEKKLAKNDDVTYNNPVMIADASGAVHFLFCVEYMRCFYSRSDDDGRTWTQPTEITASAFDPWKKQHNWKVIATGPGHGIQLRSGRLVVPVWLSLGTGAGGHGDSVSATIYSDDGGKTWKPGDIAIPNTKDWKDPNECCVAELSDGRVMLNARSRSTTHRRLVTLSPDGATQWSRPRFDDTLVEPICMGSLLAIPGKKVLLFSNPDNLSKRNVEDPTPGTGRDRKNLTVRLSDDDGQTWSAQRTIESGFSAYSDLAVLRDGTVLIFYERGSDKRPAYGRLTVARFTVDWLKSK
ncbi:MAG: sialidase family protein [Gemmataceae bacterium]|nr:glycoside hydrolase [Gemmata sp.]MDW8198908.1 sialidase family protein [Gemmataceae bacterium]